MQIQLSANFKAKLRERAAREDRTPEAVAAEALEEMLDYDAWHLARVDEGLADVEAGNVFSHEEVMTRLEEQLAQYRAKAS